MGKKKRAGFFVDVMGHDINNLNQVILTNLELLQEYNRFDDTQSGFVESAILATKDCAYTVANVRALQKLSTGAGKPIDLDLCDTLRECVREVPRHAGKKVTIQYALPEKSLIVKAVDDLKLAFCNVIANAIKYSDQAVSIDIKIDRKARDGRKYYAVTVTDDGNGIPDDIKKIFSREKGEEAATLHGKGLGLYTAKALAGASGGWLEIEDRVPGDYARGTKITIALPAVGPGG